MSLPQLDSRTAELIRERRSMLQTKAVRQQFGESMLALAFDLNDASDASSHFREQATELLANRREFSRMQFVAPGGRVLAQVDAVPNA